ncbi:septum formation protein [Limimonas halophila]|uniref:Nucleoside triphosphate pyrophosphatase n=1 Tax=Limimonas halophila TaxID=1082479 RepID=A0A1G7SME8_9PROT|nr:Maf family protein [Limimonas halophila]SDG24158.1 septum formation protein [Limimonas halophila]
MTARSTAHEPATRIGAPDPEAPPLVLASKSPSRRDMLVSAGVPVTIQAAGVDEDEIKASMRHAGASAEEVAESLAEVKAQRISPYHPGALVLGADQMLECDGIWYDKPSSREQAGEHLRALSGRTHRLIVTAVLVKDGTRIWHQTDSAELMVRPLSEDFIAGYLDAVGDAALGSVGGYQLEGLGAQLFARVRGDYFTVLGLPLLPLLEQLRNHKVVKR